MEKICRKSCNNDVPLGEPVVINTSNSILNVEIMLTLLKAIYFLSFCFHLCFVA